MQSLLKTTIYTFLAIFVITAIVTISGLVYLWFVNKQGNGLPYLGWLLTTLVAQVIGVIVMIGKRGVRYLPEVKINQTSDETAAFMNDFISHGSSVMIVSNRLAWLIEANSVQEQIKKRSQAGTRFEIITSQPVITVLRAKLEAVGVNFIVTGPHDIPEARFTLINSDRSGAERLAIAKGTHPHHEITIFDASSGPQIIGLAKDIVRKSKAMAKAAPVG